MCGMNKTVKRMAALVLTAGLCWYIPCAGAKPEADSAEKQAEPGVVKFTDVTEAVGIRGRGNAISWGDLDNDGFADLVIDGVIYRNEKGKKFTAVAALDMAAYRGPALIADFNGDGFCDLYLAGKGGALFLGDGKFHFTKGSAALNPRPCEGLAAADFDNDGWVDLYLANYENWKLQKCFPDVLLRNHRGELREEWIAPDKKLMRGRGATCCDFNEDRLIDIYVSNYRLMPNFLWVNQGKMRFADQARELGCAGAERKNMTFKNSRGIVYGSSGHTIGSVWADFDNDTYFDLFVGNFSHPPTYQDRPQFLKNSGPNGKWRFIDKSTTAAIPWQESYGSPAAGDIDNDGFVDLAYTAYYKGDTSRLFRNLGGWRFRDITATSGIKCGLGRQCAFADYDNDGRVDVFINGRLFHNDSTTPGGWLEVTVRGAAPNTSSPGTKVIAHCGDRKYIRQVEIGTGSGNQNDLRLHFGLGSWTGAVTLEVIPLVGEKIRMETPVNRIVEVRLR